MKRLVLMAFVVCAVVAAAPHRAEAGSCGISGKGTLWIDFANGSPAFLQVFGKPGVTLAASGFIYPPLLRALGAKTIYWDMHLNRRVGSPLQPFDPATVITRANKIYDMAAISSNCTQPIIAENEMSNANAVTPWSATNAQYRRNLLIYVQTLAARGARPVILVSSTPYIGDEAGDWWRQLAAYADIVRESYFAAPAIAKEGPREGSRTLRMFFRRKVAEFTSAGIPTRKLGLMLGFHTTPGQGGRERASRAAWLEVTKLQTLAARQVARELKLRSVWSWGWGAWSRSEEDPDKPAAACVYLWARDPRLCNGPAAAGARFNASRTEGQLVFPPGVRCTLYGRRVDDNAISRLASVTGDADVAFTAVFARVVASLTASVKAKQIAAAERAAAARLGGFARYRAVLAKAHASPAAARGVIADELRRAQIESRLRVAPPSAADVKEYHASYGDSRARLVEVKKRTPWLESGRRGFVVASHAPPQLFTIPQGRWVKVRAMLGTYEVRALGPAVPLGTLPLRLARGAIVGALKSLARDQRYEDWLLGRERALVKQVICRRDTQPAIGVIPLTDYLPFLAAE